MNMLISTQNSTFHHWLVHGRVKVTTFSQLAQNWNFSNKNWQNWLFFSTFSANLRCFANKNWKSQVCSRCILRFYWFVKRQRYLLVFHDSCKEICNSKVSVGTGTGRRHRVLSTLYIKHNLFHQTKLKRDAELQKNYGQALNSQKRTFFNSNLPMMWCKSLRSMHNCFSGQM